MTGTGAAILSKLTASHLRAVAALLLLSLAMFLPGLKAFPPMDRDEPRFAQASRQMIESGDFIGIRFQEENRYKKPVGIYWLQASAVEIGEALGVPDARRQVWLYRLPSEIGAILAVLLTYWTAMAFMSRRAAFLVAALTASLLIVGVEARLAKTDAVLLATVMASMGALARVWFSYTDPRTFPRIGLPTVLVFWIAMGVGVLVKGPITPMIALFVALPLAWRERTWRWLAPLRPGLGMAIVAVIVLPWIIAIILKSGSAFFEEALGKDMLGKVAGGQERHGAPPGTYLGVFWATGWPMAPFFALTISFLRREWRDDAVLFLLLWIIPAWIMFEAIPTKLPHYVMPLYPAMTILVIMAIERGALECRRWWHRIFAILLAFLPLGLLIGAPAAGWWLDHSIPWPAVPFLVAGAVLALYAARELWRDQAAEAILPTVGAALFVYVGAFQFGVPALSPFTLSQRLAKAAFSAGCEKPLIGTIGYREPSLVLLTDTNLAMPATGAEGARFIGGTGCRVALVDQANAESFERELTAIGVNASKTGHVRGLSVNRGRTLDIDVWVKP